MNHGFKLRFDQMRENNPADPEADAIGNDPAFYEGLGHTRNLCLVWPDGRRVFLNYAYLIEGEFEPGHEKNTIRLSFSSYTATLLGYSLESLFMGIFDHLVRLIYAVDERYILEDDHKLAIVINMAVEKKEI